MSSLDSALYPILWLDVGIEKVQDAPKIRNEPLAVGIKMDENTEIVRHPSSFPRERLTISSYHVSDIRFPLPPKL